MNKQRPCNTTNNNRATTVNHLLFNLQGYGSEVNYAQNIVAIPWELQRTPEVVSLTAKIRNYGWHVQIGIFK